MFINLKKLNFWGTMYLFMYVFIYIGNTITAIHLIFCYVLYVGRVAQSV
jgi:hypothetical protein